MNNLWLYNDTRISPNHIIYSDMIIIIISTQGPEEMCLSLEHQNPSKTSEKWVILIALQFRYTFYRPQTKRLGLARLAYTIKYGKGGNKFGADFRIPETQMELNEIT